jgi:hypothetical protein
LIVCSGYKGGKRIWKLQLGRSVMLLKYFILKGLKEGRVSAKKVVYSS